MKTTSTHPLLRHRYFKADKPKKKTHEMASYAKPAYEKEIKAAEKLIDGKNTRNCHYLYRWGDDSKRQRRKYLQISVRRVENLHRIRVVVSRDRAKSLWTWFGPTTIQEIRYERISNSFTLAI